MENRKNIDVVTVGEAMIRFGSRQGVRLEQATDLTVGIGGAESNVAIALSRMGVSTGWVSKLVSNSFGLRIDGELRWHGVDTSRVIWTKDGRVGTIFVEPGSKPRPSQILYDRANSVASNLTFDELDLDYVLAARHIHLTGITMALSSGCSDMVTKIARAAKEAGRTVSFDVNYRQKLWTTEEAFKATDPLLGSISVLITTLEDAERVLGLSGDPESVCLKMQELYGCPWIIVTLGGDGAIGLAEGEFLRVPGYELDAIDRVGAGDAFAAGAIYGFLHNSLETALRHGTALAALKHTILGDVSCLTKSDVELLLARGPQDIQR